MSEETCELLISTTARDDPSALVDLVDDALPEGATIQSSAQNKSSGMATADIALSFVISLAAGVTIEMVKLSITDALERKKRRGKVRITPLV